MTPAFYMDVHVPRAVTIALRLRGVDVLTAQEDGCGELDDRQLLRRASELDRVLVSQDDEMLREVAQLRQAGLAFCGVIYAHQLHITIGRFVEDLELISRATTRADWLQKVEFLPLG